MRYQQKLIMKNALSIGSTASVGIVALLFALLSAGSANSAGVAAASKDSSARDQWEEEILLQLSELRKSNGELTKQIAELRAEVQSLRSAAPTPKPVPALSFDLKNKSFPVLGKPGANIAIVEFSDFQCPYCLRHHRNTIPGLNSKYIESGKLKYVFVDFPLSFHESAEPASIAAACAHKQGAFWKMHDQLFDNQSKLGKGTFDKLAADLNLDIANFNACVADPKTAAQVRNNASLGESVGVEGTPAFLIGKVRDGVLVEGKFVSGAQPQASFERIVDSLLAGK